MTYNTSYSGLTGIFHAQIQKTCASKITLPTILIAISLLFSLQSFAQTTVVVDDFDRISNPQELAINMKLYPNPAHDKVLVEIDGAEQIITLKVLDLSGRELKVLTPNFISKSYRLAVSSLPTGTYILQIKTENGFISKKLSVVSR